MIRWFVHRKVGSRSQSSDMKLIARHQERLSGSRFYAGKRSLLHPLLGSSSRGYRRALWRAIPRAKPPRGRLSEVDGHWRLYPGELGPEAVLPCLTMCGSPTQSTRSRNEVDAQERPGTPTPNPRWPIMGHPSRLQRRLTSVNPIDVQPKTMRFRDAKHLKRMA